MKPIEYAGIKPLMMAHRGLSGVERKNTCPAFVPTDGRDYSCVETDVHVSADEPYVICRDSDLARTYVEKVHLLGHKVNCRTVADVAFAKHLTDMRVDYATNNISE